MKDFVQFENESQYLKFEIELIDKILNGSMEILEWFENWSKYSRSVWPMDQIVFKLCENNTYWILAKPSDLDSGRFYQDKYYKSR